MTARRVRWFHALLAVTLEVLSFVAWRRWPRMQAAAKVEAEPLSR